MILSLISNALLLLFFVCYRIEALALVEEKKLPQYWDLSFDVLVWYASELPSSAWANATRTTIQGVGFVDHVDLATAAFDWDCGLRVGAGHTMEHDRWDTQLYWSWFRTEAEEKIPSVHALLNTVYLEFDGSFLHGDQFLGKGASIDWSLLFNMFDWELGRCLTMSKALSMRPFIEVKGGWINQTIHAKVELTTSVGLEKLENKFWGIGPGAGINTMWEMGRISVHSFSLLGDFATAMLWGNWDVKDVYRNQASKIPVIIDMPSLGSLMLKGFLGIGWDVRASSYFFAFKLGYEMQIWFNQLRVPTLQQLPVHGDLTLQGGVVHARFDF